MASRKVNYVAWIAGLVGAAAVGGTAIYLITKPKQTTSGTAPTKPPTGGVTPTTISPTTTPGVFAAFAPFSNVSWVDQNGVPIGQGQNVGGASATASMPR